MSEIPSSYCFPLFPVQVIGPYRSGKSFLLNQLLSLSCDEGASYYSLMFSIPEIAKGYAIVASSYC